MVTDDGSEQEEGWIRDLIEQINNFNHVYKRKPKKLRRSSCSYGRPEDEVKLHLPPQFMSFQDMGQKFTSFSSLSHKNSITYPLEDEENAKIEIKS
jgi:hypothetical protein